MPTPSTLRLARHLGAGFLLALCLTACGGGGGDEPALATPRQAGSDLSAVQQASPRGAVAGPRPARSPHAHRLTLPAASEQVSPRATRSGPTPRRIGFSRSVPDTASTAATRALLQWQSMDGGQRAAALSVASPQAVGIRLGVLVRALPAAATLRVYAQDGSTAYEVAAADVLDALEANRKAGDDTDAGRTWWAPTVAGQEATLEIALPTHADPTQVDIALPTLSHLEALPSEEVVTPKIGESGSCQIDVVCRAGHETESAAVLRVSFVEDGFSYLCSGTLMADRAATRTPYVLTADHCISTQTAASTVETDWLYRASSCGSYYVDGRRTRLSGGAALLYASSNTDTSFLRLAANAPAAATFAGWYADAPPLGNAVFAVHHPEGDLQKLSTGSLTSFQSCANTPAGLECRESNAANANFVNARFVEGTTESGSSGSALFLTLDGQSYVVGQLYGGSSSCSLRNGSNLYGRLDIAYNAGLRQWLDNPPRYPVFRFYNRLTGAHFFTINPVERDQVLATDPNYGYEGQAFQAQTSGDGGASPVFRFYNSKTRAHFFTINPVERDQVLATDPNYVFEGEGWYARTVAQTGTTALYRFYNRDTGVHFFTVNTIERDQIVRTLPSYVYEGVGYHVWATP